MTKVEIHPDRNTVFKTKLTQIPCVGDVITFYDKELWISETVSHLDYVLHKNNKLDYVVILTESREYL